MTEPDGVFVPAGLCAPLHRLAVIGKQVIQRDSGGLPLVAGMDDLLAELARSASGPGLRNVDPVITRKGEWITAGQAAEVADLSARHVRRLARGGRLIAVRAARDWLIDRQSAEMYGRDRKVA